VLAKKLSHLAGLNHKDLLGLPAKENRAYNPSIRDNKADVRYRAKAHNKTTATNQKTKMNISATEGDNSPGAFPHHSGEVMERMQGTSSYVGHGEGMHDLKQASVLSKASGELEKVGGDYLKPTIELELKKPGAEVDKPSVDKPSVDKPSVDKPSVDKPSVDKPSVDKPSVSVDDSSKMAEVVKPGSEGKPIVKKKRARKKWKKPKDKPNRPLSAYNLFFQAERAVMLGDETPSADSDKKKRIHRKTHGKVGFADMARLIGSKWKSLPDEQRKGFMDEAAKEKKRYALELNIWKELQKTKALDNRQSEGQEKMQREADSASAVPQGDSSNPDSRRLQMMTEGVNRRNLSMFQQRSHQDLPTIDYLRALQDRQAERALMGRTSLDPNLFEYPNAAEASANAILQQFQSMQQQAPHQSQQLFDASARLPRYPNNMAAAADFSQMAPSQLPRYPNNMAAAADYSQMGPSQMAQSQLPRYPNNMAAAGDFSQMGSSQLPRYPNNMAAAGDFSQMAPSQLPRYPNNMAAAGDFSQMAPSQLPRYPNNMAAAGDFSQMGQSQMPVPFDLAASREIDRLQQMRLQAAMDLSQGATSQPPGVQFGAPSGDLDRIQLSQYPGGGAGMAAAMRRFRYSM
jgi:hypothetical protein